MYQWQTLITGVLAVVELDLQAVREMMALFIDHHVPARDQEQTFIALEKKAARIR
jgi:hypothetical protein